MASCAVCGLSSLQLRNYVESDVRKALEFLMDSMIQRGVDRIVLSLLPGIDMLVAEYAVLLQRRMRLKELVVVEPPLSAWDDSHDRERAIILASATRKNVPYTLGEPLREKHVSELLKLSDLTCIISGIGVSKESYVEMVRRAASQAGMPTEETTIEEIMLRQPGRIRSIETKMKEESLPVLFLGDP